MKSPRSATLLLLSVLLAFAEIACKRSLAQETETQGSEDDKRPRIPMYFPKDLTRTEKDDDVDYSPNSLTIIPEIQDRLDTYIQDHGNPIAAIVVLDAKTGEILAMSQGRDPKEWGGTTHSALHPNFPAASLFKSIVAAAGFEITDIDAEEPIGLMGGCANVNPQGAWMRSGGSGRYMSGMTLHRAYGNSCNGFFAKIAVNQIGLGSISTIAKRFGWNGQPIPADFDIPLSPIKFPNPSTSSVHTVGRFAAGFGYVGISAVHAAWQFLVVAQNGKSAPVRLFKKSPVGNFGPMNGQQVISPGSANNLRGLMDATILGGTASFAFRHSKYRKLRPLVGGKTGTLTGHSPKGLTTWFAGMMPINEPQVIVASVVILEDLWRFKAAHLAAEAFSAYAEHMKNDSDYTSIIKKSSPM